MTIKTPADRMFSVKSKGGTVKGIMHFSTMFGAKKTEAFQKAQKFVDSEVLRKCDPLVPRLNGDLIKSGIRGTVIGNGEVVYLSPYARYQYYGKLMVGPAPKKLTNIPLQYTGAPQRGAKWFERMKTKDRNDILKGAGKIAGK